MKEEEDDYWNIIKKCLCECDLLYKYFNLITDPPPLQYTPNETNVFYQNKNRQTYIPIRTNDDERIQIHISTKKISKMDLEETNENEKEKEHTNENESKSEENINESKENTEGKITFANIYEESDFGETKTNESEEENKTNEFEFTTSEEEDSEDSEEDIIIIYDNDIPF